MHRTLRGRLLLGVNLSLIVILGLSTVWDIRYASRSLLMGKRADLAGEAKTLAPAIRRIGGEDPERVQSLINEVCHAMTDAASPGHHIAVRFGDVRLQSTIHRTPFPGIFDALERASAAPFGVGEAPDGSIIVGKAEVAGVMVYVSESLADIQSMIRAGIVRRAATILALGVVLLIVLNVLLHRMLFRPLERMASTVQEIGHGNLEARMFPSGTEELNVLTAEFNRMAGALDRTEKARRMRMEKARRIQEKLLPDLGEVQGIGIAGAFIPAAEVAGDYYDVLRVADGRLLVCVADAAGHGIPAAMNAAMLKTLLLAASDDEDCPERLLARLNEGLLRLTLIEDFTTMSIVIWDAAERRLRFSSAGHEPAFLLDGNGMVDELASTGFPLGVEENAEWTCRDLRPNPGDRLVLLTDGLSETVSPDGDLFGRERIARWLNEHRDLDLQDFPNKLADEAAEFRGGAAPEDDITIIAMEF